MAARKSQGGILDHLQRDVFEIMLNSIASYMPLKLDYGNTLERRLKDLG
jgi:hypothetical protein